jgi:hypothetical protein
MFAGTWTLTPPGGMFAGSTTLMLPGGVFAGVQPQDIEDRVSQDIEDSDWGDSGVAAGLAGGLP